MLLGGGGSQFQLGRQCGLALKARNQTDLGLNPGSTSYSCYDLIHYEAQMCASFLQLQNGAKNTYFAKLSWEASIRN